MEPSPTTFRQVSGKKMRKRTKVTPPKMARNQKIAFYPRYCDRRPPRMGDREGPRTVPTDMNPM